MTAYSRIEDVPLMKYGLIKADPAWTHLRWSDRGSTRAPDQHYKTMPMQEIMDLPVANLASKDCFLWLWVPGCFLNKGEAVMNAWGFKFVTSGFWMKNQLKDPTKGRMGTGYVLRECGEPFMIGKIGNPKVYDRGIPSAFLEPRREHSRKPEQGYALADRLAPPNSFKLDLFSRQEREGWDCMGDESDKFDKN